MARIFDDEEHSIDEQRVKGNAVAVVLDPDVASVFQTSEAVNSLLRSVISALPEYVKRESKTG